MSTASAFKTLLTIAALACLPLAATATMVRVATPLGPVDIELFDAAAPATVANFLGYVRSGAFNNTFFHRSVPGFIVQAGGYSWADNVAGQPVKVPAGPAVVNEYSATRSNLRSTVAMAKIGGNPNSATTEWFVNLANNSGLPAELDKQNGGFTVFGRVTEAGMKTMDAIAALPIEKRVSNCSPTSGALTDLPMITPMPIKMCSEIETKNLVMTTPVRELLAGQSDSDRIFNYLEAAYPQYAAPASPASANAAGYLYRYYAKTNAYVGSKDGSVYYLVPAISPNITLLGTVAQWLAIAAAAGY